MALDVEEIRRDFPILQETVYNKPLVYLDNAATTQKPRCVVERLNHGYYHVNSNIHRGIHFLSQKATLAHEDARQTVKEFLNAKHSYEIVFTRGTTESINLVASSFGDAFCQAGDEIVISAMEHHSNIVPWQLLRERKGIKLRVVPFDQKGQLNMEAFRDALGPRTKLVAIAHVSNVLGTINPVEEIIEIAHQRDIPVLLDGAQSAPHLDVDVQALDADFFAFSGHKIFGPTGVGVLYGKEKWLEKMPPYQGGGEMIAQVSFEKTTFNELPFKFEAGTPDYIGTTGLAEALRYVENKGISAIHKYEDELLNYATQQLTTIPGMTFYGQALNKSSVISFLVEGIHSYDMGMMLDKMGIAVRTGHHCAQPIMDFFGIEGTVRASFAFYNTRQEIDQLVEGIERVRKIFG